MNRKWMLTALMTVLALSLLVTGCPKKKPVPPAMDIEETVVEPAEEVAPPPAPPTEADLQWWEDPEIEAVNRLAYEKGELGDVYYDYDKYDLKPEARDRLAANAKFMKDHPEFIFTVEGHCDERGTNEYNLALGDRRGSAAKGYLASLGVTDSRFTTVSYGEERPQCMESNEGCWWKNRRAHFKITGRSGG